MSEERTSAQIGAMCAGAASHFDKPNMSSRMMLLNPDFWTEIVMAMRGETEIPVEPPVPPENAPTFAAMNPDSLSVQDEDTEVHFVGTNFTEGSVILWNGSPEPTNFVSATELTTIVKPSTVSLPPPVEIPVSIKTGDLQTQAMAFTFTE